MTPGALPHVSWIAAAPKAPACDVPWLGTSVVLSDGNVNFCCFSDAIVGSVKTASFVDIWNGPKMQHIRAELSEQRFPKECQSTSCPLYRGDQLSYLIKRMDGPHGQRATGTSDPHAAIRPQFETSTVAVTADRAANVQQVTIDVRFLGAWIAADLFVAVRSPKGTLRFLPGAEAYALPSVMGMVLSEHKRERHVTLVRDGESWFDEPGTYELCVALFVPQSNPNLLSNCYWSTTTTLQW